MPNQDMAIKELRNLGPSSAAMLSSVGVNTFNDLQRIGPYTIYTKLLKSADFKPGLNLLYAMLGALQDKHWTEFKSQKGEILIQLESYLEFEAVFEQDALKCLS